jgi:hypothetical protein
MKLNKTIILAIVLCAGLQACNNFLNITPPSQYTDKTYYLTPTDFKTAITGAYRQMMNIYGQGNSAYMNSIIYRGDETRNSVNINRFMDGATEPAWQSSWATIWNLVYQCNKILAHIDDVSFPNQADHDNIKGEALAMRGWAYLQFAWCWGGVPVITQEYSLAELYKIPRASQQVTYAQADSDFTRAYSLLPVSWDASNAGRVTKYAAAGMLGRLCMYTHDYANAAKYLGLVIAQEPALYQLQANYDDCFNDAFNNTKERVWEVQYLGGTTGEALGLSQQFSSWFIPSSLNVRYDGPLMNNVTFTGPSGSVGVSQSLSADTIYETGDKRRNMTIVTGLRTSNSTPRTDLFYCKKFLKATAKPPTAIDMWGNNLPVLRYTDVKLMYAEALNELGYAGNVTAILKQINDVRSRAGLSTLTVTDLPDHDAVFKCLVHERFVEFCFEGLRWPDLIRWGLAQKAMDAHFAIRDEGFDPTTGIPTYKMTSRNLLAPIPYTEIISYNNSNIMWQNPGY